MTGTVMKASAGAAARFSIARVSNLAQAIRTIKEHNIFLFLLRGPRRCPAGKNGPPAVALVLGSEGGGPGALDPQAVLTLPSRSDGPRPGYRR